MNEENTLEPEKTEAAQQQEESEISAASQEVIAEKSRLERDLALQKTANTLLAAFICAKVKDADAVAERLAPILSKGSALGREELDMELEKIKSVEPQLFWDGIKPILKGFNPAESSDEKPLDLSQMTYSEITAYTNTHFDSR